MFIIVCFSNYPCSLFSKECLRCYITAFDSKVCDGETKGDGWMMMERKKRETVPVLESSKFYLVVFMRIMLLYFLLHENIVTAILL